MILSGERLRETQRLKGKPQEAKSREAGRWRRTQRRHRARDSSLGEQGIYSAVCYCDKMSQAGNLYKTEFQVY